MPTLVLDPFGTSFLTAILALQETGPLLALFLETMSLVSKR